MQRQRIHKLTAGTVFKLLVVGNVLSFGLIFTLIGVSSGLGCEATTVTWNDEPLAGVYTFLLSPVLGVGAGLIWGLGFGLTTALGLKILSHYRSIEIVYEEEAGAQQAAAAGGTARRS